MPSTKSHLRISGTSTPIPLPDVQITEYNRILSIPEFDRILGGGLVPDSAVLIGGEPGIGKSTLILQVCGKIKGDILYVSAEESVQQCKLRADRMNINANKIKIVSEPNVSIICKFIKEHQPSVVVIDSIQAVFADDDSNSSPGTVNQVRESASILVDFCKRSKVCLILVGHITKDGAIAGPKTLEHLVDCVLYFEGDRSLSYRILRATKNRFGATESGMFQMTGTGLTEIDTAEFVSSNEVGSAVCPAIIGARPVMIEIQSLIANAGGSSPVRRINGLDPNRVAMIMAVLERTMGVSFSAFDVYVNVAGGLTVTEPGADLAIAMSLISSLKNVVLPAKKAFAGEIGLTGEIRTNKLFESRTAESSRFGFQLIIPPKRLAKMIDNVIEQC